MYKYDPTYIAVLRVTRNLVARCVLTLMYHGGARVVEFGCGGASVAVVQLRRRACIGVWLRRR